MLMHAIESYLKIRRALGYKLESTEYLLRSFAAFAIERGDTHVVGQTAVRWAERTATQHQRDRRIKTIIHLARFLRAEDPKHEIPPDGTCCKKQYRPTPYILTEQEIRLLLQEAGRLGPPGSLRPHTYSTLLGLLAATGLRISEALSLRINDFTSDGLLVRETKFRKTRLLPLHHTSASALVRYLNRRRHIAGHDDHIFVSLHGRKLLYKTVHQTFKRLCVAAGLPKQPGVGNVRLHDIRHTYAVRVLERCPHNRDRVSAQMLALTTYMGHACVHSTFWYLESTPQLMQDIAHACESFLYGGAS